MNCYKLKTLTERKNIIAGEIMQDLGLFTGESLTKYTCMHKSTHTKNRKVGPFYTRVSFDTQDFPPRCTTPLQRCQRWTSVWGQTQYVTFDPSQTLEQHIILLVDQDEHACVWECESVSWCLCLALTLVTCAIFSFLWKRKCSLSCRDSHSAWIWIR